VNDRFIFEELMTAGIILAAGVSSRMGSFKPLLPIGDTIFIRRLVGQMRSVGTGDIVVVTGYRHEELEEALKGDSVVFVRNDRFFDTQMLDSVKLGVQGVLAMEKYHDRIMLSPADVVMSPQWIFETVAVQDADFVRPMYHGKPGHPVLIKDTLYQEILSYEGERGLRGCVENSGKKILELNVEEPNILLDADTREDYRKAVSEYDALMGEKGRLHADIELKLVTDEPVCGEGFMQILELVESTGSLQNAAHAMKMSYTKMWKVVKFVEARAGQKLIERETGGENGGCSYLTEHGRELLQRYKAMRRELDQAALQIFDRHFSDFRF